MNSVRATYASKLVSKKARENYHPSYVLLEEKEGGNVVGFTYVIPDDGVPNHIQLLDGTDDWDKCHRILTTDKKCSHKKWHNDNCMHYRVETNECTCVWRHRNNTCNLANAKL